MNQVQEEKKTMPSETKLPHVDMRICASAVYEQTGVRQEVRDALERFEHQPITKSEIGPLIGLNVEEMKMLDVFWEPTFNKGWLYLSDDMVRSQLTNEKGDNAVTNFNKRVLVTKDYKSGEDYKQVEYDDPLIVLYLKSRPSNLKDAHVPKKIVNKRYYAVTGETYKDLLSMASTEGGKASRLLYRKIEAGARLMYDYINTLHAILAQQKIEETRAALAIAESNAIRLEEEKRGPREYQDEWFYLATCEVMAKSRAYKFGYTAQDTPKKRLTTYDCGYTEYCALDYVLILKTKCARATESAFRVIVSEYLKKPRIDIVLLPFVECRRIAQRLVQMTELCVEDLVILEKNFPAMASEPLPAFIKYEDAMVSPDMEPPAKLLVPACTKCGKEYARGSFREKHQAKCAGPKPTRRSARLLTIRLEEQKMSNAANIEVTIAA